MSFQDVAFLPSKASFYTTFVEYCGRCEGLRTTTFSIAVDVGRHGDGLCRVFLVQRSLFFVSVEFHEDHVTVTNLS